MDRKKIINVLREIRNISGEISLTGHFEHSVSLLIKHYNACLSEAINKELLEQDSLFVELSEDSNVDEIGVSAALLSKYLKSDDNDEN